MAKAEVKCGRVSFFEISPGNEIALLDRLSNHPKLGPPRAESQTQTSLIIRKDLTNKRFETLNTIYVIVD
jgi:hypothetical protein